jgi:hypothetical protein
MKDLVNAIGEFCEEIKKENEYRSKHEEARTLTETRYLTREEIEEISRRCREEINNTLHGRGIV